MPRKRLSANDLLTRLESGHAELLAGLSELSTRVDTALEAFGKSASAVNSDDRVDPISQLPATDAALMQD